MGFMKWREKFENNVGGRVRKKSMMAAAASNFISLRAGCGGCGCLCVCCPASMRFGHPEFGFGLSFVLLMEIFVSTKRNSV